MSEELSLTARVRCSGKWAFEIVDSEDRQIYMSRYQYGSENTARVAGRKRLQLEQERRIERE